MPPRRCAVARTHLFPPDRVHYVWNNALAPVLEIDPGDTKDTTPPQASPSI